jgi:Protein CHAPERONE-LIKE PROTEIN OF POR1-like
MDEKQMSEQNPYTTLEVRETASFEEIQGARDRLIQQHQNDERSRQAIEAAYDAVLMDRLRKRQEGKVAVPDRIRLAEDLPAPPTKLSLPTLRESPRWLQQLFDKPSGSELLVTSIPFASVAVFCLLNQLYFSSAQSPSPSGNSSLTVAIAFGIGFCLYWINRKEQRLGRAVVITLLTLVLGGCITYLLEQSHILLFGLDVATALTLVVLSLFWLASSFLR